MIYTVGYQHWNRAGLDWVVGGLKALLLDVRSLPKSRKPGFGQRQLQATFGDSYRWAGDVLGGRAPGVTPEGVALLAELDRKRRPVVLLCLEDLPHNCHRHHTICAPHFPKARHIFNGGWCYSVADVQANYAAYPEPLEIYPVNDRRLYALTEPDGCA